MQFNQMLVTTVCVLFIMHLAAFVTYCLPTPDQSISAPTRLWKAKPVEEAYGKILPNSVKMLYWPRLRGQGKSSVSCATSLARYDTSVSVRKATAHLILGQKDCLVTRLRPASPGRCQVCLAFEVQPTELYR